MSSIKNVYIKSPKKSINNKNSKISIKKNNLKEINDISNSNINIKKQEKNIIKNYNSFNKENIKIIKKNDFKSNYSNKSKNSLKKIFGGNIINKIKKSYSRNKNDIKRLNVKKKYNSKKKEKYIRLIIDSDNDVKGRIETKKNFHNKLMNLSKKQIRNILIRKGLIKKNSKAPLEVLKDIYLNSKLIGDINVIQQKNDL